MNNWFRKLAASCAIIPLAQCAMVPGGNIASAAEAAPAAATKAATKDADPALWVVKDDDTTIYLFGTVHVLKPGLSWFDEAVKDAFDKSDALMLEMVLPEDQAEIQQVMLPLAIDPERTALSSRLDNAQRAAYYAAMDKVGLPATQFDIFEPWFAAVTLSVAPLAKLGYDPEQGAEKQLTRFAKSTGKPIAGFEDLEEQLGFLDRLPADAQLSYLNSVVRDIDKMGPTLDTLVAQWAAGNPEALAETMNESMAETPEVAEALLFARNARWADQIKTRMDEPGTVFVAVGAGHLAGDRSVQVLLAERGLVAERVDY